MEQKFLNLDGLSVFLNKIKSIFATIEQGNKAETALQKEDISSGTINGTILVKDTEVSVKGLGSAAYTETSSYNKVIASVSEPEGLSAGDIWLIIES